MINRVLKVALFTGSAHLISYLTIVYVLGTLGEEEAGYIGIVDSSVLLISTITSFGIQLSVNRNVATQKGWRSTFVLAQSGRMSLSFLVIVFGILSTIYSWDLTKVVYFYAPLIALNGDYALYGAGKPVDAARLSFFRVAIPNAGLLLISQFREEYSISVYIILVAAGVFIAGFFSSRINKVPYLIKPSLSLMKVYYKYFKVGLFQVASAVLVTGLIVITKGFYEVAVLGLVYGVLKIFEVFKGGLRIIVQTFFREFQEERTGLRIDKVTLLIGLFILIPATLFPVQTLSLIYGDKYAHIELVFSILGLAMFIASFKTSADITALLKKKDNLNMIAYPVAMLVAIVVAILYSYKEKNVMGIPLGVLCGEITLFLILGLGLKGLIFYIERIRFLLRLLPLMLILFVGRLLIDPTLITLGLSCLVYFAWVWIFHRDLFLDKSFLKKR